MVREALQSVQGLSATDTWMGVTLEFQKLVLCRVKALVEVARLFLTHQPRNLVRRREGQVREMARVVQ